MWLFQTVHLGFLVFLLSHLSGLAQGTAFTYQGRLTDNGNPANGSYLFRFSLDEGNGIPVGSPVTTPAAGVSNGLFTVTLDFGAGIFTGDPRRLLIEVRTNDNGSPFVLLTPPQPLLPAPYAIFAAGANAAGISGSLPAGSLSGTYSNAVNLTNVNNVLAGNGGGLTNVNAARLGGLSASNFWQTSGNAGTTPGVNFLGTTDNQPLEIHVNGGRALRLEPTTTDANHAGIVNVVGGSVANVVGPGVIGATIAGGGASNHFGFSPGNRVDGDFGFVGGGSANTIQNGAGSSTIGGGGGNTIQSNANESTIGGGVLNTIQSSGATIGGGRQNVVQPNASGATIGGGWFNVIEAFQSAIGGGWFNRIQTNASNSTIGGGDGNAIQTNARSSTIGGGVGNTIQPDARFSTIGGGENNTIQTNASGSAIGGGGQNAIGTNAEYSVVAGGRGNQVVAAGAAIMGGRWNTNSGTDSTIGGGTVNAIAPTIFNETIGGGLGNSIGPHDGLPSYTLINYNSMNVIGGGSGNTIQVFPNPMFGGAGGNTIAGGLGNIIRSNQYAATIAGGKFNIIGSSSFHATIGGGSDNNIETNSSLATIPGGAYATARSYGQQAYASGGFDYRSGSAQASLYVLRSITTNAILTELFLDGNEFGSETNRIDVPLNGVWSFDILIAASISGNLQTAGYQIKGSIVRGALGTTLAGTPTVTILNEDAPSWDATVEADNANSALVIKVKGAASTTIRWVASVRTVEVVHP